MNSQKRPPQQIFLLCLSHYLLTQMQKSVELGNQLDLLFQGKHPVFSSLSPSSQSVNGSKS